MRSWKNHWGALQVLECNTYLLLQLGSCLRHSCYGSTCSTFNLKLFPGFLCCRQNLLKRVKKYLILWISEGCFVCHRCHPQQTFLINGSLAVMLPFSLAWLWGQLISVFICSIWHVHDVLMKRERTIMMLSTYTAFIPFYCININCESSQKPQGID